MFSLVGFGFPLPSGSRGLFAEYLVLPSLLSLKFLSLLERWISFLFSFYCFVHVTMHADSGALLPRCQLFSCYYFSWLHVCLLSFIGLLSVVVEITPPITMVHVGALTLEDFLAVALPNGGLSFLLFGICFVWFNLCGLIYNSINLSGLFCYSIFSILIIFKYIFICIYSISLAINAL